MSLKRKRPGKLWVTGKPRAQIRKAQTMLRSLLAQQDALAPAAVPITPAMQGNMNFVLVDLANLLLLLS